MSGNVFCGEAIFLSQFLQMSRLRPPFRSSQCIQIFYCEALFEPCSGRASAAKSVSHLGLLFKNLALIVPRCTRTKPLAIIRVASIFADKCAKF